MAKHGIIFTGDKYYKCEEDCKNNHQSSGLKQYYRTHLSNNKNVKNLPRSSGLNKNF